MFKNLSKKVVCVTGGNGFIGKQLIKELLKKGYAIKVLTRSKNTFFSKEVEVFVGDLTDLSLDLSMFIKDCDILFHCAVEKNNEKLMRSLHVEGTKKLISAIASNYLINKKKIHWVQLSSCGVYGPPPRFDVQRKRLITENSPLQPANEYEKTKAESDDLIKDYAENKTILYTILRPSNVIGETMPDNYLLKLIKFVNTGSFFFIGKKDSIATYIHLDDVVSALIKIITNSKSINETFNISCDCRWEDLIFKISLFLNVKTIPIRIPYKFIQIPLLIIKLFIDKLIHVPLFAAFVLRTNYSTKKIEDYLSYEFSKPLPKSIEDLIIQKKITNNKNIENQNKEKLNHTPIILPNLINKNTESLPISVVMPVYNDEKFLNESILSVLSQTFKKFEFIIVNDGSTDSSLKIINKFADSDKRIKVVNKPLNTGITDSLNCGIDIAKGQWIARIDADDVCEKNRFEIQYLKGISNESLALIGSYCWEIDENGKKIKLHKYPQNHLHLKDNLLRLKSFFPHSSYFIRAKYLKKINGYRNRMKRSQDFDLSLRISEVGEISCIKEPLIFLRKHSRQITFKDGNSRQIIYPRTSLFSYFLKQNGMKDPLDSSTNDYKFNEFYELIRSESNLLASKNYNKIFKKINFANQFSYYSNIIFVHKNKKKILKKWFKKESKLN